MRNQKSFSGFTVYTVEGKEDKGREGREEAAGSKRNTRPERAEGTVAFPGQFTSALLDTRENRWNGTTASDIR